MRLFPTLCDRTQSKALRLLYRSMVSGVGFLLVATAIIKTFWPADAILIETTYEVPSWWTTAGIQAELAIGLWLLSSWRLATARIVTTGLFVAFALFSLYRSVAGYESCGCFGQFVVNPWWTFIFDVGIAVGLSVIPLNVSQTSSDFWVPRTCAFGVGYACVVMITLSPFYWSHPSAIEAPGVSIKSGLVILKPEEWVGNTFPLCDFLSSKVDVETGEWNVLIYRHDCLECQKTLKRYERFAKQLTTSTNQRRVLLIESPPFSNRAETADTAAFYVRLVNKHTWLVQTPAEIEVRNGLVTNVSTALSH